MAARIFDLEKLSKEDLPEGMAELARSVRNMGFDLEDGEKTLVWNEKMAERYATFGAVETGDRVRIEREPLLQDGAVLSRGLVRKVRRS